MASFQLEECVQLAIAPTTQLIHHDHSTLARSASWLSLCVSADLAHMVRL